MASLESNSDSFAAAKAFLSTPGAKVFSPSTATKLKFYGLFKQATKGDCDVAKPWAVQVEAAAKWSAWDAERGRSCEEAMAAYVALLTAECPDWSEEEEASSGGGGSEDAEDVALALAAAHALKREFDRDVASLAEVESSVASLREQADAHASPSPPPPPQQQIQVALHPAQSGPSVVQISIVMQRLHERFKVLMAENARLNSTVDGVQARMRALEEASGGARLLAWVSRVAASTRARTSATVALGGAAILAAVLLAVRWVRARRHRAAQLLSDR